MRILLGPGAMGHADSMAPYVSGLRRRGFDAHAIDLPRGSAERAVPAFIEAARAAGPSGTVVGGGHSFGGRVAGLAATESDLAGLVLFSYPLHPPGRPSLDRAAHWPGIRCRALLICGDRDEYARPDLLKAALPSMPRGELAVMPGAGHGLSGHLETALDLAARFLSTLCP